MQGANHTLATKLIYASTILHNYLVVHSQDKVEIDTSEESWSRFFATFEAHRCPECTRARKAHCPHQATFRNNNMHVVRERRRPTAFREEACAQLWAQVLASPDAETVIRSMNEREGQAGL